MVTASRPVGGEQLKKASELRFCLPKTGQVLSFRGTRIPVSVILDYLAAGMTEEQIRAEYSSLPRGAVAAALAYAAFLA